MPATGSVCHAACSRVSDIRKDRTAQAQEQELELPEDMTLDDDGMANADEAEHEGADTPQAEGDAPEMFPEPPDAGADDGGGAEQAGQDADMAEQADAQDGVYGQPTQPYPMHFRDIHKRRKAQLRHWHRSPGRKCNTRLGWPSPNLYNFSFPAVSSPLHRLRALMLSGLEDMRAELGTDAQLQDLQLDEAEDHEGASGAEEEEDEAAEPAAKHGWNEDEAQKDALPEAGPQGLASQSAAAQVRPHLRCAEEACGLCASQKLAICQDWAMHALHSK